MEKQYRKIEEVLELLSPMQIATLSDIYDNGDGALASEDTEKSIMYCKRAAEMGNAYAQSTLANAYTIGRDVDKSDELALFWYKKRQNKVTHTHSMNSASVCMTKKADCYGFIFRQNKALRLQ